jgi:hypothetical protein
VAFRGIILETTPFSAGSKAHGRRGGGVGEVIKTDGKTVGLFQYNASGDQCMQKAFIGKFFILK